MTDWIGGRRPVLEALAAGARPSPDLRAIESDARRVGLPVERTSSERLSRLAGFDGHQGVLLEVGERRWASLDDMLARARERAHDPFVLVLEHLQDPTNFGTLLRAATSAAARSAHCRSATSSRTP